MDLKNCAVVLFVRDAKRAKDFYSETLGLEVVADFGGLNYIFKQGFAIWQLMENNMIKNNLGEEIYNPENASRFELCFETDDFDNVYKTLKKNRVRLLHEINTEPWGQRNIRFYDPDGHLIEVGESLHIFIKRIYDDVNDIDKVADLTFTNPEMVKQILGLD